MLNHFKALMHTKITNYKNTFTFALYQDGESWVAHNLEFDILAVDKNKEKAVREVKELTKTQIEFCIRNGLVDSLAHPAPERFWKLIAEKTTANIIAQMGETTFDPKQLLEKAPIYEVTLKESLAKERQSA